MPMQIGASGSTSESACEVMVSRMSGVSHGYIEAERVEVFIVVRIVLVTLAHRGIKTVFGNAYTSAED